MLSVNKNNSNPSFQPFFFFFLLFPACAAPKQPYTTQREDRDSAFIIAEKMNSSFPRALLLL